MYDLIIVDDNDDVLCFLQSVIENISCWSVRYLTSPREAYDLWIGCGAKVLLTDIQMPEMNGEELLVKLRDIDAKFVAFAMTGGPCDHLHGCGFEHVFKKPFSTKEMLARLRRTLAGNKIGCEVASH